MRCAAQRRDGAASRPGSRLVMAMTLFGVAALDPPSDGSPAEGAELIPIRDLVAVVAPSEYALVEPGAQTLDRYRGVIEAVFNQRSVLPAPPGTIFRSRETLLKWMELHYVALSDALSFVDDRAVARVHICRASGPRDERDKGADLAAAAADAFRLLRRRAVLAIPLKTEHITGLVLSSTFLVEKELWKEFAAAVTEEQANSPSLALEMSGPWPPYDFVRMQFGV